ncbi:MAG: GNAT family N-acetyltransferase [Ardenticatenales bacterium]|nr:GNAT family N-acetyltransferase [Ardenticatenales bacterium]
MKTKAILFDPDDTLFDSRSSIRQALKETLLTDYQRGAYRISTDPTQLDVEAIFAALSRSYWAATRPREIMERALRHSLCFGLYDAVQQIGLARLITDYATYAYLCDVYVLEEYRGQGLGKWLIDTVMSEPDLQGIRRWSLVTRDAHGLYEPFGFHVVEEPSRHMEYIREYRQE